jgi:nucleoside 2-deoxyribosyltransferase
MQTATIIEAKKALVKLHEDGIQFFTDAAKLIKQAEQDSRRGYISGYWSLLSPELQKESNRITEDIIESIKVIAVAVRMSPLLTDVDERELGLSAKTIRAALHLRAFRFQDVQVINDEDILVGIQPATQSDEREQHPVSARYDFDKAFEKALSIVDLTTTSDTELQKRILANAPGVSGYKPNTAFIMMWMDNTKPELLDVSDTIKECFKKFGIKATRADEIEHADLITKRILEEIRTSEFLCADLTGERPSVYYEVGYAHAIGKRVILYRKKDTRIHFDLAGYNCPEYENNRDYKEKLTKRLEEMTGRKPETI